MRSTVAAKTTIGMRRAPATIRWIMLVPGGRLELLREQDRAVHDDLLPGFEPVPDLEPLARLPLVDVDGHALEAHPALLVPHLDEGDLVLAETQQRVPGDRERALLVHGDLHRRVHLRAEELVRVV